MKQLLALILLGGMILTGCQEDTAGQANTEPAKTVKQERMGDALPLLPVTDVIESGNSERVKNVNRFYRFLENAAAKEPDQIQIVQITTEGDPIRQDIRFDGTVFYSTVDSSRDKYGPGGISKAACTEVTVTETAERTDYQLAGCENQEEPLLLVVWK